MKLKHADCGMCRGSRHDACRGNCSCGRWDHKIRLREPVHFAKTVQALATDQSMSRRERCNRAAAYMTTTLFTDNGLTPPSPAELSMWLDETPSPNWPTGVRHEVTPEEIEIALDLKPFAIGDVIETVEQGSQLPHKTGLVDPDGDLWQSSTFLNGASVAGGMDFGWDSAIKYGPFKIVHLPEVES